MERITVPSSQPHKMQQETRVPKHIDLEVILLDFNILTFSWVMLEFEVDKIYKNSVFSHKKWGYLKSVTRGECTERRSMRSENAPNSLLWEVRKNWEHGVAWSSSHPRVSLLSQQQVGVEILSSFTGKWYKVL